MELDRPAPGPNVRDAGAGPPVLARDEPAADEEPPLNCRASRLDLRTSTAPTASWAGVGHSDVRAGHPEEARGGVESAQQSRAAEVEGRRAPGQGASEEHRSPATGRRNKSKIQSVRHRVELPSHLRRASNNPANAGSKRRTLTRRTPGRSKRSSCATQRPSRPSSRSSGSFSGTAARGGALLRSRETRRRYERETPPPAARRDDVRVLFGNKHILLGGGAAALPRVSPPMSPQVLGPTKKDVRGARLRPKTGRANRVPAAEVRLHVRDVGAFLRYICRRDELNATARARYVTVPEMTDEQLEKHVAASTRSLPIAHAQRSRPLPPPAGTESRIHE